MDQADRTWFQSRLPAWSGGLLDDADSERFEQICASDAVCRAATESFTQELPGATSTHIPTALLSRWPEAQQRLAGLERDLMRRHLEACSSCREELELLGFEPSLAAAPDHARPARGVSNTRTLRVVDVGRSIPGWRNWLQAAVATWAVAATAAVLVLIANRSPSVDGPPSASGAAPAYGSSPAGDVRELRGLSVAAPVISFISERSIEPLSTELEVKIPSDAIIVLLKVRDILPPADDATPVVVRVQTADGSVRELSTPLAYSEIRSRPLQLTNFGRPLPEGLYVLTLEVRGIDPIEKRLRLEYSDKP